MTRSTTAWFPAISNLLFNSTDVDRALQTTETNNRPETNRPRAVSCVL